VSLKSSNIWTRQVYPGRFTRSTGRRPGLRVSCELSSALALVSTTQLSGAYNSTREPASPAVPASPAALTKFARGVRGIAAKLTRRSLLSSINLNRNRVQSERWYCLRLHIQLRLASRGLPLSLAAFCQREPRVFSFVLRLPAEPPVWCAAHNGTRRLAAGRRQALFSNRQRNGSLLFARF